MLVTPLSLDRSSLLTLYFPEKTNEYGTSVEIADMIDGIIPRDEYSDEMFMLVPTLGRLTDVTHDDDVFEDIISPVVPRELRIGLELSSDERNSLIQLLRSYLDVFAWSYENMLDFHPSIVQHRLPLLPHAKPYPEWLANVVHVPKNDDKVRVCVDFQYLNKVIATVTSLSSWCMYFDGEANHSRYEISVLLISPYGDHILRHVPLVFSDLHLATNNIVEYEACILGLEITLKLEIRQMEVFGDSNLVLRQIQGHWKTRDAKLRPYHAYLELLVRIFNDLRYTHLPRTQNQFVNALVWTPQV
ncbi:hypothetical protein CK203_042154 [Vitis vinifera]|uniref:RNase H type-1 domain-containing protein n=1 Tax=Vitis vinifera TaxID=29760 RepID=A0A438HPX2_VITVI|nr:hypothetical protein CK203_042154 [Vitis vinifera]